MNLRTRAWAPRELQSKDGSDTGRIALGSSDEREVPGERHGSGTGATQRHERSAARRHRSPKSPRRFARRESGSPTPEGKGFGSPSGRSRQAVPEPGVLATMFRVRVEVVLGEKQVSAPSPLKSATAIPKAGENWTRSGRGRISNPWPRFSRMTESNVDASWRGIRSSGTSSHSGSPVCRDCARKSGAGLQVRVTRLPSRVRIGVADCPSLHREGASPNHHHR